MTRSRTISAFSSPAWKKPIACWPLAGRSICISTTARCTTPRSCWTTSSGARCFLNEIIWAYDYGGRTKKKWPPKHDNILVYAKDLERYYFNTDEVERIPYMAPGLVGPEKAARGKLPTDTWWHTIVPTNGKERTGYPTQKPVGIARRIIQASCPPGGTVMDFFAGSGTVGEAAHALGRRFVLIDDNPEALAVMARRFAAYTDVEFIGFEDAPYRDSPREASIAG